MKEQTVLFAILLSLGGIVYWGSQTAGRYGWSWDLGRSHSSSTDGTAEETSKAPTQKPAPLKKKRVTRQELAAENSASSEASADGYRDLEVVVRPPEKSAYDLTIVGNDSGPGALADFGIFRHEPVYTVYVPVTDSSGMAAPEWTLEYAPLSNSGTAVPGSDRTVRVGTKPPVSDRIVRLGANPPASDRTVDLGTETAVDPPVPIQKEYPRFPTGSADGTRMVVVYAVINTDGTLEQMRILKGFNPALDRPLLEALGHWSFQPARQDEKPIAVKAELGIVLPAGS